MGRVRPLFVVRFRKAGGLLMRVVNSIIYINPMSQVSVVKVGVILGVSISSARDHLPPPSAGIEP
jgi:hypothetical protein